MKKGMYEMNPRAGLLARATAAFIQTYDPTNDIVVEVSRLPEKKNLHTNPLSPFHSGHMHASEVEAEGIELEIESKIRSDDYTLSVAVYGKEIPGPALYTLMEAQRFDSGIATLVLVIMRDLPESAVDGLLGDPLSRIVELPGFLQDLSALKATETSVSAEGATFKFRET